MSGAPRSDMVFAPCQDPTLNIESRRSLGRAEQTRPCEYPGQRARVAPVFLKTLEIHGFKSFADRTLIEFAPGITALLGPNGCGKSNVVDAIKWVVGEQAAKTLRAEKMEDVIFNGTEARKPLGMAEVSLTVSNEGGLLNLDMSEVCIKRRLYRSGESEYYINNELVRLKEIKELFWDTGVGKSAYSVMEQGKIDQILSSRPEERRYLFEEAAGITRHKARSREAETKLQHTEENMRQVDLLLAEVKRSYDSLKVQCEKTLRYRALKDECFSLELDAGLLRLRNFTQEYDRRSAAVAKTEAGRDGARAEIDALNKGLEESLDFVNSLEARVSEAQKTVYGLAVERAAKERHRKSIQERIQEAREKVDQSALKLSSAKERREDLIEDRDGKEAALRDLRIRIVEIEKNAQGFEERIKEAGDRIKRNEEEAASQDARIKSLESGEAEQRVELDAITDDIVAELDSRLRDSGYSSAERRAAEAALEGSLAALIVLLQGRSELLGDFLRSPSGDSDAAIALLERARDAVAEALERAGKAKESFDEYRRTSPSFLDDFLSPEGIITRKRAIDAAIQGLKAEMEKARARIREAGDENRGLMERIEEYRATLEDLRLNLMRSRTQVSGEEEGVRLLDREISGQEALIKEIEAEMALEEKRLKDSREELEAMDSEIAGIDAQGKTLTAELEKLEKDIAFRNSDLSSRQDELKRLVQKLGGLQDELERLHLDRAQTETEIRGLKENFKELHSRDLMEFEERMFEIREPLGTIKDRLLEKRQALRDLGSVNFMAPEEFAEVKERYEFLSGQLDDLRKAREDLFRVTSDIRTESTELFLATYNRIKRNFHNMFRRLFGGGRAELRLVDPEHVLESGIDIYAQPPGKKLENISLLSGGEKSMTAVSLLFSTYAVKPSPFCFLDEIDAALDEQNVVRFVQVLREFGATSQFIVITHNKKTVVGASTLLGVTMEESGITKVIAVRLDSGKGERPEPIPEPAEPFAEEEVAYETGTELPSEAEIEHKKRVEKRERARKRAEARAAGIQAPETEEEPEEGDSPVTAEEAEAPDDAKAPDSGTDEGA
jgi:chromosome segregation protein